MLERTKIITRAGMAAVTLGAAVFAGFQISEPEPPRPGATERAVGHWTGRPLIPAGLNNFINTYLPSDHKTDGTMTVDLYHDSKVGNYGMATFTGHGDASLSSLITCTPDGNLDFALDSHKSFMGRTKMAHFTLNHENPQDVAERVCSGGKLTAQSIQQFANPTVPATA